MMMMARPVGPPRDKRLIKMAIEAYIEGEKETSIAKRYSVTQPTISYWVKRYGKELCGSNINGYRRVQGRRTALEPCDRDREIMALIYSGLPATKVGTLYGITRARVSFIMKTWKDRGYVPPPMFEAGQVVERKGHVYKILKVHDHERGDVLETGRIEEDGTVVPVTPGITIRDFKWYDNHAYCELR